MEGIITLAGSMPRIGTTTQAIGLARYISECSDYKVAYVECNAQNYIWSASELYRSSRADKASGHMTIEGIEMYNAACLQELTGGGSNIDYLILDYGDMNARDFDKEGFLKGSAHIVIGGVKPNELHYMENALRDDAYSDAIYIFTHVPAGDIEELKDDMGFLRDDTFFSPYMPDPFQRINEKTAEYYESLMPRILKKIKRG